MLLFCVALLWFIVFFFNMLLCFVLRPVVLYFFRSRCRSARIDGVFRQGYRYYVAKTKMEYQLHRGWEEITPAEAARGWIGVAVRGDASVLVGAWLFCRCCLVWECIVYVCLGVAWMCLTNVAAGRIDPQTSQVLRHEVWTQQQLQTLFDVQRCLKFLSIILSQVSRCLCYVVYFADPEAVGSNLASRFLYIISLGGQENSVSVHRAVDSGGMLP